MKEEICLVTGGFDPLHRGHIEYFKSAKKTSQYLIVGLNSDSWLCRKKKYLFMPLVERKAIVENLQFVDEVITFNDDDDSANNAISKCLEVSKKVIFANGGDRQKDNTPELIQYGDNNDVEFLYGIGGSNKINSSSWMIDTFIKDYSAAMGPEILKNDNTIIAPWGHHTSFIDSKGFKVKQLNVKPGAQLSLQKHEHRSEHWVVVQGKATVELDSDISIVSPGNHIFIPLQSVHRLTNNDDKELIVVEVQCGDILEESDITRFEDSYGRGE
jgi:cytidyltransferase-like protein